MGHISLDEVPNSACYGLVNSAVNDWFCCVPESKAFFIFQSVNQANMNALTLSYA
jgi:hypothetical protein